MAASLPPAPSGKAPAAVEAAVICAAITRQELCRKEPEATRQINVVRTLDLIRDLVEAETFVVFLSTNLVFDGSRPQRRGDEPLSPKMEYGRQKAEVEEALRPDRTPRALDRIERHLAQETLPAGTQTPSQAMRRFMWEQAVQPEESGHGSSRPWEQDDSRQAAEGQEGNSALDRLSRQMAGGRQWGRYLRVVLLGR